MDITMTDIIERLTEWRDNILCDIQAEEGWGTSEREKFTQRKQWHKLDTAIMHLNAVGKNNNIHE